MKRATIVAGALIGTMLFGAQAFGNGKIDNKQKANLPKIIGGVNAVLGDRPWMASLQLDGEHFCGGSLIASRWILTAAHCVEDLSAADRASLAVRLDFTDLNASAGGETRAVEAVYEHPDYANNPAADVALLRLATPVPDAIPRLPLADQGVMAASGRPGDLATVSGWGNTSSDGESFPALLKQVVVPIVSNADCNAPQSYGGEVQGTELCAGYPEGGRDSCQGDSGGPLVVGSGSQVHQIGIVSWGDGCALPDKYGVYARVTSFNAWISQTVGSEPDAGTVGFDGGTAPGNTNVTLELISGELVTGLAGEQDSERVFEIRVPSQARLLWVDIKGGAGDADIYLRRGKAPTTTEYDFAPLLDGNREHVLRRRPEAGRWFILLHGYSDFRNVELMAVAR